MCTFHDGWETIFRLGKLHVVNLNTELFFKKKNCFFICLLSFRLKHYAGEKEALETELFSRFILVLNEKKAKIRSLQQRVTHLQEARYTSESKHPPPPPELFVNDAELIPLISPAGVLRNRKMTIRQNPTNQRVRSRMSMAGALTRSQETYGRQQPLLLCPQVRSPSLNVKPSQALRKHLESSSLAYIISLNNCSCGIIKTRKNMSTLHCCRGSPSVFAPFYAQKLTMTSQQLCNPAGGAPTIPTPRDTFSS